MAKARVNGVELAYDVNGAGDPLVLIHGAQGGRDMYNSLVAAFSPNFQVLTYDQRGIGESEKPDVPYSMAMLADDMAALMDHAGLSSAFVFGASMGGMIAQEFALRYPQKARALVLGCTTCGGPHAVMQMSDDASKAYSTETMTEEQRGRAFAEAIYTKGYIERHPEVIQAAIESRKRQPLDPAAFRRRMEAAMAFDSYDQLPEIACPTLVIAGKQDATIPSDNSKILAERIPGAQLIILDPAGHLFWEEQPEQVHAALTSLFHSVK
jgi:pimeloyl-ACP methyl ester carboxylesterase